jgi:hypothetical protein
MRNEMPFFIYVCQKSREMDAAWPAGLVEQLERIADALKLV